MDGLNLLGSTISPGLVARLAFGFLAFAAVVSAVVAGDVLLGWLFDLAGLPGTAPGADDRFGPGDDDDNSWRAGDSPTPAPSALATAAPPSRRRRVVRSVRRPRLLPARPVRRLM